MNINLTPKELEVIALIEPTMTAEEVCNKVLRDWFNQNSERMYNTVKTKEQKLDEIIAQSTAEKTKVDTPVL